MYGKRGILGLVASSAFFAGIGSCQKPGLAPGDRLRPVANVRDVRVLLSDQYNQCRVRVDGPMVVRDGGGHPLFNAPHADWTTIGSSPDRRVVFGDRVLPTNVIDVVSQPPVAISLSVRDSGGWSEARRYPGFMRIAVDAGGRVVVINHVDIENYVACVLPGELYAKFAPEAFRAQSVAVRTYVLYQMAQKVRDAYDVSATESSQVYPGLQGGDAARKAREATQFTRGIVATWTSREGEQVICTFYSSCCGGVTQSVANCRKDVAPIPPLSGGVTCECERAAPPATSRWGPLRIAKNDLTTKLAAKYPQIKSLGRVEGIEVADQTSWGRPKVFRLVGSTGARYDLVAEDFRLAIGSRVMRSTFCKVLDGRDDVQFADGRGFGHAMGMCQWGMQEMALRGFRAGQILKHYYPNVHLTRCY